MNCTYVTLLSSDDYIWGVIALNYSLKKVNSQYSLLVLAIDNLSNKTLKKLEELAIDYKTVKNKEFKLQDNRYKGCLNKFYCWGLTDYDKVMFLDADTLVLMNLDSLFHYSTPVFNITKGFIWGGQFIITPDEELEQHFFENYTDFFTDEEVLNCFYNGKEIYDLPNNDFLLFHDDEVGKYWIRFGLNSYEKIKEFVDNKLPLLFYAIPKKIKFILPR